VAKHMTELYETYGHFISRQGYVIVPDPSMTVSIFERCVSVLACLDVLCVHTYVRGVRARACACVCACVRLRVLVHVCMCI